MKFDYRINPSLDIPIYTQLIDMIRADITAGRIPYGTKLPTVRELGEQCSIARGTVIRAYSELEQQGYLEKIQGRGTFVSYKEDSPLNRKDSAMAAIDSMLDTLDGLSFSRTEAEIFIELKLRERYSGRGNVTAAVVECNFETLFAMSEQLKAIDGVDVYTYRLDDVMAYPYKISGDADLIVVSASHSDELLSVLPDTDKLAKAALHLTPASLAGLSRIDPLSRVCIMCQSRRFGDIIAAACGEFAPGAELYEEYLTNDSAELDGYDAVIVPGCYRRFCGDKMTKKLRDYSRTHRLVCCDYVIDDGSMLYLTDRIAQIQGRR